MLLLLVAWAVEPPPGVNRARVLTRAAQFRDDAGETFIEETHVRRAIADIEATS